MADFVETRSWAIIQPSLFPRLRNHFYAKKKFHPLLSSRTDGAQPFNTATEKWFNTSLPKWLYSLHPLVTSLPSTVAALLHHLPALPCLNARLLYFLERLTAFWNQFRKVTVLSQLELVRLGTRLVKDGMSKSPSWLFV